MADDTVAVTLEAAGESDELTVPRELLELLREDESESIPSIVADVAMFGLAQRIHGAAHHGQGDADESIARLDDRTMELFEERFGASFGELTGHDH